MLPNRWKSAGIRIHPPKCEALEWDALPLFFRIPRRIRITMAIRIHVRRRMPLRNLQTESRNENPSKNPPEGCSVVCCGFVVVAVSAAAVAGTEAVSSVPVNTETL